MHLESIAGLSTRCHFGMCHELATRPVVTPTPIGARVELLCAQHAQRRAELDAAAVQAFAEREPIPYTLTDAGRAEIAS